jgi:hypothetical protein
MDASQWEPIAERIAAAFPDAGFDGARRAAYLDALSTLPADAVSRAVDGLLTQPRAAPPSAAVIRQAVKRADVPAQDRAWLAPAEAVRRAYLPALVLLSSAVAALALVGIAIWWAWGG